MTNEPPAEERPTLAELIGEVKQLAADLRASCVAREVEQARQRGERHLRLVASDGSRSTDLSRTEGGGCPVRRPRVSKTVSSSEQPSWFAKCRKEKAPP